MGDERFKKPYDAPPRTKEPQFKDRGLEAAINDVCKIMRSRELDEDDRMMSVEDYIKERYNPQESIVIPSWAHKIAANYRGDIILIDKRGERRERVVVRTDGTIYLD